MKVFVTVADARGFAPAAQRLGMSPSAVTRLVARLEGQLGIRLLQRTTRSVTLTDAGARYLERARRILSELEEAEESAPAERTRPTGRLVVSAPAMFGRLHVSPLMCRYLTLNPEVVGELTLSDRMVSLVEDGIDLAVRIGHLADSSLIARRVGSPAGWSLRRRSYLERHGVPATPQDLVRHQTIQFNPLASRGRLVVPANTATSCACRSPRTTSPTARTPALWHAEHDGGLTLALSYQVVDAVKAGRLRIVLEAFEPPPLPIHFVYPSSRLLSAKVRAFVELAAATCDWRF